MYGVTGDRASQSHRRRFGVRPWWGSRVGLQKVLTLWLRGWTGSLHQKDCIISDPEEILITQGHASFRVCFLTWSWTMTLDGTLWYLEEVQRAFTGTGRECALSASCSLQRLWISLSRRTFSLPKSCTRCSEGQQSQKLSHFYIFVQVYRTQSNFDLFKTDLKK